MAEWLVEEGIAEHRAVLAEAGRIVAARVDWLDRLRPGLIADGQLFAKPAGAKRGVARLATGEEVLVDGLPPEITEGMTVRLKLVRAPLAERGRTKRATARPAPANARERSGPSLLQSLGDGPHPVRLCRPDDGRFAALGWDELVEEALTGEIAFAGGSLIACPTPAMTVIDVDGGLPPRALAMAAIPAIAAALRRLDLGGAIGIDFPTLADRKDRQAVDSALAEALQGWPGERTAMNGFGFVQLVARLERPSIPALYQRDPARVALVTLARRAEALRDPGTLRLCAHPALSRALPPGFDQELSARTGRLLEWHWDEGLALHSPGVQAIAP